MIGNHLKRFRESVGMTQQDIADQLHLTRSAISKIENDLQEVTIPIFKKWVQVTNSEIQAAIILFGTDIFVNASNVLHLVPAFAPIFETVNSLM